MANLIVRGIDETLVRTLKHRAAKHGRSAEAEHREILASALRQPRKRHLAEALASNLPTVIQAPMENAPTPTPGHWNINDIYRKGE